MKKLLAIILVIGLMFCFAACDSDSKDDVDEDEIRGSTVDNTDDKGDDTADDKEFDLGKTSGLTYENKFIGIGCNLPSDWSFYDDDQIKELNKLTEDYAEGDLKEALKDANIIYDMCAKSSNNVDNVSVNLEKIDNSILKKLDISKNNEKLFPSMIESFENMGYSDVEFKNSTVKIDGKTFVCIKSSASISDVQMNQIVFSIKCNGYLASVSLTAFGDTNVEDLLDCFYLVD